MVNYHLTHAPYGTLHVPEMIAGSLVNSSVNPSKLFVRNKVSGYQGIDLVFVYLLIYLFLLDA